MHIYVFAYCNTEVNILHANAHDAGVLLCSALVMRCSRGGYAMTRQKDSAPAYTSRSVVYGGKVQSKAHGPWTVVSAVLRMGNACVRFCRMQGPRGACPPSTRLLQTPAAVCMSWRAQCNSDLPRQLDGKQAAKPPRADNQNADDKRRQFFVRGSATTLLPWGLDKKSLRLFVSLLEAFQTCCGLIQP